MGGDEAKAIDFEDMPDDNDDVDELEEYEAWKVRELKRVKRERAEREKAAKEQRELERRRNLTDEQRRKEDEEFPNQRSDYGKEKEKWKFLQKCALVRVRGTPTRAPTSRTNPNPNPT